MKTGKPGKAKPAAAKPTASFADDDDDDDPFAAAQKSAPAPSRNVPGVSPRKDKTNSLAVACPMCETEGFVNPNLVGKEVKCRNDGCVMPVFKVTAQQPASTAAAKATAGANKSQRAAKTAPAAPEKAPREPMNPTTRMIIGAVGSVAFVAIVAGVYLFFPSGGGGGDQPVDWSAKLKQSAGESAPALAQGTTPPVVDPGMTADPVVTPVQPLPTPLPNTVATVPVQPIAADTAAQGLPISTMLEEMSKLSATNLRNRSKPYSRRISAWAHAAAGDYAGSRVQLQRLEQLGANLPHYAINALMVEAWGKLAAGDAAGAKTAVTDAEAVQQTIPRQGSDAQEILLELAAAMTATGRPDAARALLIERFPPNDESPLVLKILWSRAIHDYRTDRPLPGVLIGDPQSPRWTGVVLLLVAHGQPAAAKDWALKVPTPEAQTAAIVTWADAWYRLQPQAAVLTQIETDIAALAPEVKAQVLGRLAVSLAERGETAPAERLLATAIAETQGIMPTAARSVQDYKELLALTLPDAVPLRQQTRALAAVALAQGALKQTDAAWATWLKVLAQARGIAPSPAVTTSFRTDLDSRGLSGARDHLRRELALKSDDEAKRKLTDVNRKLAEIDVVAKSRFALQTDSLIAAVNAGLVDQVWLEARGLSEREQPAEQEPYLYGRLATHLLLRLQAQGPAALLTEVEGVVPEEAPYADAVAALQQQLADQWKARDIAGAIATANGSKPQSLAEEPVLALLSQALEQDQLQQAFQLSTGMTNLTLKEEALRRVAALAALAGQAPAYKSLVDGLQLSPTEKLSAYLGLIEGETARAAASKPATEVKTKP